MQNLAILRLKDERSNWRKDHPYGFVATPCKFQDGSLNYLIWNCSVPGLKDTLWENGQYHLNVTFPDNYPFSPPICRFYPVIFHPNVCRNCGRLYASILEVGNYWNPTFNIKHLLQVIQLLLHEPSIIHVVNEFAHTLNYQPDRIEYCRLVERQAMVMSDYS